MSSIGRTFWGLKTSVHECFNARLGYFHHCTSCKGPNPYESVKQTNPQEDEPLIRVDIMTEAKMDVRPNVTHQ